MTVYTLRSVSVRTAEDEGYSLLTALVEVCVSVCVSVCGVC